MRSKSLEKGFGIVEVLIAAGLMAIVAVGIASLVVNMQTEQKRMQVRSVLTELKNRHMALLTDNNSWTTTISNNPNMACIASTTGCAAGDKYFSLFYLNAGVPTPISTSPANLLAAGPYSGFTESGEQCSGFIPPPTVGTDACPIGYSLVWQPLRPNEVNSSIKITIRLVYNGLANNKYQNSAEVSYRGAGTFPVYNSSSLIGKNDIQIVRNATAIGRQFTVSHTSAAVGVGGNCSTAPTETKRPLSVVSDPSSLINFSTGTNDFTFRVAGLYKCSIMAVGFSVNTFSVILKKSGTNIATGNGYASTGSQATANLETTISVATSDITPTPAVYSLYQQCEIASAPASYGMGVPPVSCMGDSTYASITCVKSDD